MSVLVEDASFKVIILGDSSVGKSCLLTQFVEERFDPVSLPTIGVGYGKKTICDSSNHGITLEIWDTVSVTQAGQELYKSIARSFYHKANAALLVYDLTRMRSFEGVESWLRELRTHVPAIPIYLVGNMKDLSAHREVPQDAGQDFARDMKLAGFMEVSAMTGLNVLKVRRMQLFKTVAQDLMNTWLDTQQQLNKSGVSLMSVLKQQFGQEPPVKKDRCKC